MGAFEGIDKLGRYQPPTESCRHDHIPSPHPEAAVHSPKLAALHARLSLPERLPLQTLARSLVDVSADSDPAFNNSSLAILGSDILGYYTSEFLLCHYPRLPMVVLFAAQSAYVGPKTLAALSQEWGVEAAACPGGEVDPGLLQFTQVDPGAPPPDMLKPGTTSRPNDDRHYRRGLSSRIVYDDQFGDMKANPDSGIAITGSSTSFPSSPSRSQPTFPPPSSSLSSTLTSHRPNLGPDRQPTASRTTAYAPPPSRNGTTHERARQTFVRALCGALYLHCGKPYTRSFFRAHILSRSLRPSTPSPATSSLPSSSAPQGLASLFAFTQPTRDLSRLCAREGFEPPVARLISETGRASRHPVFVVGVYSGRDKLGEGAGSSLDEARFRAAANALRGWYLYTPGEGEVSMPSETEIGAGGGNGRERGGGKKYIPPFIDPGEVVV
ncbi:ribonuclease III [Viridothelium virens]|uniref:Large ribosomal subunit protein mL44 n=1 Tax=Viridothelium virens TaxID=1048519 RepID=A0A6A6GZE2_VIRVR|nr:ribonuclease III [Viridothelium virens]